MESEKSTPEHQRDTKKIVVRVLKRTQLPYVSFIFYSTFCSLTDSSRLCLDLSTVPISTYLTTGPIVRCADGAYSTPPVLTSHYRAHVFLSLYLHFLLKTNRLTIHILVQRLAEQPLWRSHQLMQDVFHPDLFKVAHLGCHSQRAR